jgi:D-aspartate ligase
MSSAHPNPQQARPGWPPVVIAGAFQTGVLAVRGLKRRGVRAVSFDCNPGYPGFRSVYGPARLCPDPDTHPEQWVAFMIELAGRLGERPVLIPSADQFVSAAARHAGRLRDHFVLSPGLGLQGDLADKATQYTLAERLGMPMPNTRMVSTAEEVVAFASEARFPCLVKPLHFREWQALPEGHPLSHVKTAVADTPDDLVRQWQLASAVNRTVILQEIILGLDSAKRVYLSVYDRGGRRIGHAMLRELRCDPVGFGPASVTEPIEDEEADQLCDQWLRRIGYSGICEIEVKRDTRDGQVKLIEANPRLSGSGDAAPYLGVDLCWLHYLDLVGESIEPVGPSGRSIRHVVLSSDVRTVFAYRRRGLVSWREVLRSYRPPVAFYDLDLRDWRVSLETLARAGAALGRGLFEGLAGGRRGR